METLAIEVPEHIRALTSAAGTKLTILSGAPLVAINSVQFARLTGYEGTRFQACLAAADAYSEAGVPQIVMVDGRSHYQVPIELAKRGAIVVTTLRPGLATPYLDAAQLVRLHAGPRASVLKAEGDKLLTAAALSEIKTALSFYDVVVGDRTLESLESLSAIQQRTEALIDAIFELLLDIPHGASSGVQAYTPKGLQMFLNYENFLGSLGNNWKYLAYTPAIALQQGLPVGSAMLDLAYDADTVKAEDTPALALKRLEQLMLMLEGGYEVLAAVYDSDQGYCREMVAAA